MSCLLSKISFTYREKKLKQSNISTAINLTFVFLIINELSWHGWKKERGEDGQKRQRESPALNHSLSCPS